MSKIKMVKMENKNYVPVECCTFTNPVTSGGVSEIDDIEFPCSGGCENDCDTCIIQKIMNDYGALSEQEEENTQKLKTSMQIVSKEEHTKEQEPIFLSEMIKIELWLFEVELTDRRTGLPATGCIAIEGNEDSDLDEARVKIAKRYAQLGYTVNECKFEIKEELIIDTMESMKQAIAGDCESESYSCETTKCNECEHYVPDDAGAGEGCTLVDAAIEALKELEEQRG